MKWKSYWDNAALSNDSLQQVGRLNADEEVIRITTERIINLLGIKEGDRILDVCCGNGLITDQIDRKGYSITGIDLSGNLIKEARSRNNNINFEQQDALSLELKEKFNKIFIAFSFQYFDSFDKGKAVIQKMKVHSMPGALILLTDVPDKLKWNKFYNTVTKKFFYYKQKITGTQSMGKFWSEYELTKICQSLGLNGTLIRQPNHLPYSHYRFDYLIRVNEKT